MAAIAELLEPRTRPETISLFNGQAIVDRRALERNLVNPRKNSHGLEFDSIALPIDNIYEDFPFFTQDGRFWIVRSNSAFVNGYSKIPTGYNFNQFVETLRVREQSLGINPEEEHHNGIVDLIWKNWKNLWLYFRPDIHYDIEPECFREIRLDYPATIIGQPDLVGIGPNGGVYIIEVGGLGAKHSKRKKIINYTKSFREIFGDNLTIHSNVVYYKPLAEGYLASFESPKILSHP